MLQDIKPKQYRRQMRNVHRLIQIVTMATDGFVRVAKQVAEESPDYQVYIALH